MGKRGPQSKPRELLESKGSRVRSDRYVSNPLQISSGGGSVSIGPVKPPTHLKPGAKKIWREVSLFLNDNNLSHAIFNGTLEIYCTEMDKYQTISKYLKKKDVGYTYLVEDKWGNVSSHSRPEVKIMNDAANQVKSIASAFGLTPSSKSQISSGSMSGDSGQWGSMGKTA